MCFIINEDQRVHPRKSHEWSSYDNTSTLFHRWACMFGIMSRSCFLHILTFLSAWSRFTFVLSVSLQLSQCFSSTADVFLHLPVWHLLLSTPVFFSSSWHSKWLYLLWPVFVQWQTDCPSSLSFRCACFSPVDSSLTSLLVHLVYMYMVYLIGTDTDHVGCTTIQQKAS